MLEGKDGIIEQVRLHEHRDVLTRLFLAVDGDHLYARFIPESASFVREDFEELAALATHHFAVTEDEGLDFLHQAVLCVCKTDSTVNQVRLFYFTGVVLACLARVVYFNLVKYHISKR